MTSRTSNAAGSPRPVSRGSGLLIALLFALPSPVIAQDASPARAIVRVIGREDGLPRPGVFVHVAPRAAVEGRVEPQTGFLAAVDERVRALRAAQTVRTDPDGRAALPIAASELGAFAVFTGSPFESYGVESRGGEDVLRVVALEPFVVRAVASDGEPLAGFAVALHAGSRDVALALTDARGIAVLGVPTGHDARLHVAPAGWIGGYAGFPSVAAGLDRQGPVELVVPPFGSLRLRALRRGTPATAVVRAAMLYEPVGVQVHAPAGDFVAAGFEFGPVAVGGTLRGTASIDRATRLFEVAGPATAGECVVVDFEVDPPRARIGFRLTDAVRDATRGSFVRVAAVTDRSIESALATVDSEGHVVADFDGRLALGAVLSRVDVDIVPTLPTNGRYVGYSAAVPAALELKDTVHELGVLTLDPHAPVVDGRVVDEHGAPVADATVEVVVRDDARFLVTLKSDANGDFQLVGPVPRDASGAPVPVVAVARLGDHVGLPSAPQRIGARVSLVLPGAAAARQQLEDAREGTVVARFVDLPAAVVDQLRVELVADVQPPRVLAGTLGNAPGAAGVVAEFRGVAPGRFTLRLRAPYLDTTLFERDGIDVPVGGLPADAQLTALEIGDALRVATLRVVDRQDVPIAGAVVDARAGAVGLGRATDARGEVAIVFAAAVTPTLTVRAEGLRPHRFVPSAGTTTVRLEPAGTMLVRVKGLPADLTRDALRVVVQPADRFGLADAESASLGDHDTARLALPSRGTHVLALDVTLPLPNGGSQSWRIVTRPDPVGVGDGPEVAVEFDVDAAAVARARDALRRAVR